MPFRPWGITRQELKTLTDAFAIAQEIRDEMVRDPEYAGNVENIDHALATLQDVARLVSDHLTAEGK